MKQQNPTLKGQQFEQKPYYRRSCISQSVNGKILIFQYKKYIKEQVMDIKIIKLINLSPFHIFPSSPLIIQRKNHPKLRQFIILNTQNKPINQFIQQSILKYIQISKQQHIELIKQQNNNNVEIDYNNFMSQLYIMNNGNRIGFWLNQEEFQLVGIINQIVEKIMQFTWLRKKDNIVVNQIQYGSQSFVSLIEMFSLRPISDIMSLEYENYSAQKSICKITQKLHYITSLVNYNYRYFYPPKSATRFLKKTCGIQISSLFPLPQINSSLWSQQIFLRNLFQIYPTYFLSSILFDPQGPIYLKSYIFSEIFYKEIEKVYYMGKIKDYIQVMKKKDGREYVGNVGRVYKGYIEVQKGREMIGRVNKMIEREKVNKLNNKQGQQQYSEHNYISQQYNKIKLRYHKSFQHHTKTLTSSFLLFLKQSENQSYSQFHLKQSSQFISLKFHQISQLNQICLKYTNFVYCPIHGVNQGMDYLNKQIKMNDFLNMWRDTICMKCLGNKNIKNNGNDKQKFIKQQVNNVKQVNTQEQLKNKQNNILKQQQQQQQQITCAYQTDQRLFLITSTLNNNYNQRKLFFPYHLLSQKHFPTLLQSILLSKNQSTSFITFEIFHDTFMLSRIINQIQFSQQQQLEQQQKLQQLQKLKIFLNVYEFYFMTIIKWLSKIKQWNQNQQYKIQAIYTNLKMLRKIKYKIAQKNVINNVLKLVIKQQQQVNNQNNNHAITINSQKQSAHFFLPLHQYFLQSISFHYSPLIKQHYSQYKQKMNSQYKITAQGLKQLISQFHQQLKQNIIKTTEKFMNNYVKWMITVVIEYSLRKGDKVKKMKCFKEKQQGLNFYQGEIKMLIKMSMVIVQMFNQPGQNKVTIDVQSRIVQFIILLIKAQKVIIFEKYSQQIDLQIIQSLVQSILDDQIKQKTKNINENAMKLVNKHLERYKTILTLKFNQLKQQNQSQQFIFDLKKQLIKYQLENLIPNKQQAISLLSKSHLKLPLSSIFYQNHYFQLYESTFRTNYQIRTFINLISNLTNKCWKNQNIFVQLQSQKQKQSNKQQNKQKDKPNKQVQKLKQRIKLSIVYKIIAQTLQKQQNIQKISKVFKNTQKALINLINYLISLVFSNKFQHGTKQLNQQSITYIKNTLQLYFQRQRYYYTIKSTHSHQYQQSNKQLQTKQILDFLFTNRHKFFPQSYNSFETHYHLLIQIILLNTFPLFDIELTYKTELKNIGKILKSYELVENCTQLERYYIKVVEVRHNKAKEKRKEQLDKKKEYQELKGGNKQKQKQGIKEE